MIEIDIANITVLVAVFFALIAGHLFHWHLFKGLVDERKQLKAVPRHIYGTTFLILGYTVLAFINHFDPVTILALIAVAVAAGLGTILPRGTWLILDRSADDKSIGQFIRRILVQWIRGADDNGSGPDARQKQD